MLELPYTFFFKNSAVWVLLFFGGLEAEIFLWLLLDYREEYSLLLHLDRFCCILSIFNMQKYTLEKVSAPVTFLYYMIKIAEVLSEKYNLNPFPSKGFPFDE